MRHYKSTNERPDNSLRPNVGGCSFGPDIFWHKFKARMGDLTAWVVMIVGSAIILGLACWLIPGLGGLLISFLGAISSKK